MKRKVPMRRMEKLTVSLLLVGLSGAAISGDMSINKPPQVAPSAPQSSVTKPPQAATQGDMSINKPPQLRPQSSIDKPPQVQPQASIDKPPQRTAVSTVDRPSR